MRRGHVLIATVLGALLLWSATLRVWSGASGVQTMLTLRVTLAPGPAAGALRRRSPWADQADLVGFLSVRRLSLHHWAGLQRSSPWHDWAPYLVARATVRKATLSGAKNDPAILAQTEAQLKAIVAAPGDDSIKSAAERLLSFVEFHLHPEQRVEEVGKALMRPGSEQTLAQDLSDYQAKFGSSMRDRDGFYVDDLADWLATFGGTANHSIAQWKKSGALQWLIAALATVPGSDANAPALIDAAAKVKPDSPA